MRRAAILLAAFLLAPAADAQPGRFAPPPPRREEPRPTTPAAVATPVAPSRELRAHVGVDMATRLLRSSDADERLRGISRAGQFGSAQAVALLVGTLETGGPTPGAARLDARALIEVARGLSRSVEQSAARSALKSIVETATPARSIGGDDGESAPRAELAREIAAIALASSGEPHAAELLIPIARGGGPGQNAATLALSAFPPQTPGAIAGAATPQALRLAALLGDLRSVDVVRSAIKSSDPLVRAAALVSSGELGDMRTIELARAALGERDPRVRTAAAEALVLLDAPEKRKAVEALLAEDVTALLGARLAERAQDAAVSKALAARVVATRSDITRSAAIAALGRGANSDAVRALVSLLANPKAQGDAADALARSPSSDAMTAIENAAGQPSLRRLAVRAYIVRALVRGERSAPLESVIAELERGREAADRALGVFARVTLHDADAADFLGDREPRVRRAAALGSLVDPSADTLRALLDQRMTEVDEPTRVVLGIGLMGGDPDGRIATSALLDRAESGGPDAYLAAMALARRSDPAHESKVDALLRARDPLLRAHAARGLGMSPAKNAPGRLAEAWAYETNTRVRRAIITALAMRSGDAGSPSRQTALESSARTDPDAAIRFVAQRALSGRSSEMRTGALLEVAWMRLATAEGKRPTDTFTAAILRSDGLAVPIAFDDDGYALLPGFPPGDAMLVLAPRVPSYEPGKP